MSVRRLRAVVVLVVLVALGVGASAASAAGSDRTAPTKPGNVRVTATTQTSISLAWNASTDNSGNLSYRVQMWEEGRYVTVATLPKTETSYTKTELIPNVTYYFAIEAVDPSGNKAIGDLAYATTLPDRTPPPAPANLRVTSVTASQVALAWDAPVDDTGIRSYQIGVNDTSLWNLVWTGPTSLTVVGLAPDTAHSFTVKAQDLGYNFSPATAPVSATTEVSTDVTPPTAPTNLVVRDQYCGEVGLRWTQSTDDQDPQAAIRYRIFINGASIPSAPRSAGTGGSPTAWTAATRSCSGRSTAPATSRRRATRSRSSSTTACDRRRQVRNEPGGSSARPPGKLSSRSESIRPHRGQGIRSNAGADAQR